MENKPNPKYSKATLDAVMLKIITRAKDIPEDQQAALETVEMCLLVLEGYAEWVNLLQQEIIKLVNINTEQSRMLKKVTEMEVSTDNLTQ